jgi:hypothetical protein
MFQQVFIAASSVTWIVSCGIAQRRMQAVIKYQSNAVVAASEHQTTTKNFNGAPYLVLK